MVLVGFLTHSEAEHDAQNKTTLVNESPREKLRAKLSLIDTNSVYLFLKYVCCRLYGSLVFRSDGFTSNLRQSITAQAFSNPNTGLNFALFQDEGKKNRQECDLSSICLKGLILMKIHGNTFYLFQPAQTMSLILCRLPPASTSKTKFLKRGWKFPEGKECIKLENDHLVR